MTRPRLSLLLGCGVVAVLAGASAARAACTVSGDAGAVVRPIRLGQEDASLVISMSMAPKLLHVDYATAVAKRPACDLGGFTGGGAAYELYGDDVGGPSREALPAAAGSPVAVVLPVADILKALAASKEGKASSVDGYLLATLTRTDLTGWRFYTGLPAPDVLKADMAQALSGALPPIFRNEAGGKTALFVPKG